VRRHAAGGQEAFDAAVGEMLDQARGCSVGRRKSSSIPSAIDPSAGRHTTLNFITQPIRIR
jgi:hypothetical protein